MLKSIGQLKSNSEEINNRFSIFVMRNTVIMNENLFFKGQARKIIKMQEDAESVEDFGFMGDWDNCAGHQDGNNFVVEFRLKKELVKKLTFKLQFYKSNIKPIKNTWINNRILNRSGMAEKLWPGEDVPNKLRRRLEQKAERDTLSRDERKKIEEEILSFYAEFKRK
jgi:hypothetical protein